MQTINQLLLRSIGPLRVFTAPYCKNIVMPKKQGKGKRDNIETPKEITEVAEPKGCIFLGKGGTIMIEVLAKPGAKNNNITGLTPEGVGIQIAAPPVEGEANSELVLYLSKVLKVRKSDVTLEKGSKSRNKMIAVHSSSHTVDSVRTLLEDACN